jgi:hypothetical protein
MSKSTLIFEGGPDDINRQDDVPPAYCRERWVFYGKTFLRKSDDGSTEVVEMQSRQDPRDDPDWDTFTQEVYTKTGEKKNGAIIYEYDGTETVRRCTATNATDGERCSNDIVDPDSDRPRCRTHS